jgi:hypothetical protein
MAQKSDRIASNMPIEAQNNDVMDNFMETRISESQKVYILT